MSRNVTHRADAKRNQDAGGGNPRQPNLLSWLNARLQRPISLQIRRLKNPVRSCKFDAHLLRPMPFRHHAPAPGAAVKVKPPPLRNLDPAGRGRTTVASAPREMSSMSHQGNNAGSRIQLRNVNGPYPSPLSPLSPAADLSTPDGACEKLEPLKAV
jgi:hypothetical protein